MSGSSSSATRPARPAPAGAAAIEVSHLTKTFGARTAVADVSFSVARGEVFGFLGPNGAGKTTTVRILGTLIAPTAGSAVVAGIPLGPARAAEIRERISIMPEAPGLYRRLTVSENLDYFARLYSLPHREQRAEDPHRGRLARPVRAQEAEHLAARDAERHVGHGGPRAEVLGQVADLYRRGLGRRRPRRPGRAGG